jgi:methionine-rich copper-binding protein CopC
MIAMGFSASARYAHWFLASTMMTPPCWRMRTLSSRSRQDSVVSAPQALTLNFSEGIEPEFSGVVVTDAQKQVIKTGTATRRKEQGAAHRSAGPNADARDVPVDWHVVSRRS